MKNEIVIPGASVYIDIKNNTLELLKINYDHCIKSEYKEAAKLYKIAFDIIKSILDTSARKEYYYNEITDLKSAIELIEQDMLFCEENRKQKSAMIYKIIVSILNFALYNTLEI